MLGGQDKGGGRASEVSFGRLTFRCDVCSL